MLLFFHFSVCKQIKTLCPCACVCSNRTNREFLDVCFMYFFIYLFFCIQNHNDMNLQPGISPRIRGQITRTNNDRFILGLCGQTFWQCDSLWLVRLFNASFKEGVSVNVCVSVNACIEDFAMALKFHNRGN